MHTRVLQAKSVRLVVSASEFADNLWIAEIRRIPVFGQESLSDKSAIWGTHCEGCYDRGFREIQKYLGGTELRSQELQELQNTGARSYPKIHDQHLPGKIFAKLPDSLAPEF